jgi:hypothetical protein
MTEEELNAKLRAEAANNPRRVEPPDDRTIEELRWAIRRAATCCVLLRWQDTGVYVPVEAEALLAALSAFAPEATAPDFEASPGPEGNLYVG